MTFLEICQRVQRESDTPGSLMADVTGQPQDRAQIVTWVQAAWEEIQTEQPWNFRQVAFSQALTASTRVFDLFGASYLNVTGAQLTASPLTLTHPTTGQKRRVELLTHQLFEAYYADAEGVTQEGWPTAVAIAPTGDIEFNLTLDVAYTLSGWYIKAPQALSAATDVPEMAAQYHQAIVYRALRKYAEFDEASVLLQSAIYNDQLWTDRMARDLLPKVLIGGTPLA